LKIPEFKIAAGMLTLVIVGLSVAVSPIDSAAGDARAKININVACHCADPVGQNFCAVFKEKIQKSIGYQLAENTSGYGMGVHFACVDMWQGIDNKLSGRMSAVSVSFTIYSDKLPGEVFEDSSVFRVGKAKVPEMSDQIVTALGQFVSANTSFFESMRTGGAQGASSGPSSEASPGTSSEASPGASSEPSSEPSAVPSP
jgi:hypothetical protein